MTDCPTVAGSSVALYHENYTNYDDAVEIHSGL